MVDLIKHGTIGLVLALVVSLLPTPAGSPYRFEGFMIAWAFFTFVSWGLEESK